MEPPPESGPVKLFDLGVEVMSAPMYEEGSYMKVLRDIHQGVGERAEWEHRHPDLTGTNHPNTIEGKFVLPSTPECFVVRVTSRAGYKVCYLFEWSTLYNIAFFVDSDVEAHRCWYIYSSYANSISLPPVAQFQYVRQQNVGFHVLKKVSGSYDSLGRKNILLGPENIDGYVLQLYFIRNKLLVGNQLVLSEKNLKELMKGALSFAPVVISEPSRFGQYKSYMCQFISCDVVVPRKYINLFTIWGALSKAISDGKGYTLTDKDNNKVDLIPEEVRKMVCLLCRSVYMGK